ncbi:MAG TPA: hypothetical protein VD963_05530 [Phycisphaerales bacterium]|nr:hypothetical protein [Phycisphaerales bacterium]
MRAGYWAAHENWQNAEQDLLIARTCFPENRDIAIFLARAMLRATAGMFSGAERSLLLGSILEDEAVTWLPGTGPGPFFHTPRPAPRAPSPVVDVERINRENAERLRRQFRTPADSPADPLPGPSAAPA